MNLQEFKDSMSRNLFGMSTKEAIRLGVCVACKRSVCKFKNDLDEREYFISGLCPKCFPKEKSK